MKPQWWFVRILSYVFLGSAILGLHKLILFILAVSGNSLLAQWQGSLAVIATLLLVPAVLYVQQKLVSILQLILLRQSVRYDEVRRRLNQVLTETIHLPELAQGVLHVLHHDLKYQQVNIILSDSQRREYSSYAHVGGGTSKSSLSRSHPLVAHFSTDHRPLIRQNLRHSSDHEASHTKLLAALEWFDVDAAVPLFVRHELTGLILVGKQKGQQEWSAPESEFLHTVADMVAPRLEHARLYHEEHAVNARLQQNFEEAMTELTQANEQLHDLDRAKSDFLSIASHQLYTPLTAIRGYLSMLKEGDFGTMSQGQEPIVHILDRSATRLISLIRNLLDLSRIESGFLELNLASVDLAELAKELVADIMPNAMKKNLDLEFLAPEQSVPSVVADRERIRQVMLNFIDNAIKYTDRGRIQVTVKEDQDDVVFSVSDTGRGISSNQLPQLFSKFTRVNNHTDYQTEGTGLGLYIARQIVQEHHGRVDVSSPGAGRGSTFTMRLPAEGSHASRRLGDHATVEIKATESTRQSQAT